MLPELQIQCEAQLRARIMAISTNTLSRAQTGCDDLHRQGRPKLQLPSSPTFGTWHGYQPCFELAGQQDLALIISPRRHHRHIHEYIGIVAFSYARVALVIGMKIA